MKDLREYPRTRYRRAWIVKDDGVAMNWNGSCMYYAYSHQHTGEVFFVKADADFVAKKQRRLRKLGGYDKIEVHVQPVMVPRSDGGRPHVRALRIMRDEERRENKLARRRNDGQ